MCTVTNFEPKQRMQSILRTPWTSSTPSSARLVSTVEVRWRAESVLDGQGPGIPHRRGHIAGGCFIGRRGWLWTSTPVWYSEFVQQPGPQVGMEDWSSAAHAVRQQPRKGCEQENCSNHATQTSTASRPTFFPEQRWEARRNRVTKSTLSCFAPTMKIADTFTPTSLTCMKRCHAMEKESTSTYVVP